MIFFRRRGDSTRNVVLGSAATLALAGALVLVVSNLTLIVGGSSTLAAIFGVMPLVLFGGGMLLSRRSTADLAEV
ncbi:hypothetical protein [Mycolicibacterium nivoides]|uniref:Uncharacterized protein n=1 Tax=Mycolicibacterium nivoides TaxID=2487344 RepID=A0ABW9LC77_9MYCO